MESRNPILSRKDTFSRGGYATFGAAPSAEQLQSMYDAPAATPLQTRRMTYDDVVVRTALLLGVVAATGTFAWVADLGYGIAMLAAIVGLALVFVVSFKKVVSPGLILGYAAAEGIFIGVVSHGFESAYGGIVLQAVLGTGAAFVGMLAAYKTGKIRVTPKFQRMLIGALIGFVLLSVTNLVAAMFTDGGLGLRDDGALGLLFGLAGVTIASLMLVLDFDYIEKAVQAGAPEKEAWLAAFGLVVTLVWLYIELLRLLAILRGD